MPLIPLMTSRLSLVMRRLVMLRCVANKMPLCIANSFSYKDMGLTKTESIGVEGVPSVIPDNEPNSRRYAFNRAIKIEFEEIGWRWKP